MVRLLELQYPNHVALIHDLVKNATILAVIELLQKIFINDPLLDKIFINMFIYTLVGNLVYYLVVDKIVGSGPIMVGSPSNDKQE